MDWWFVWKWVQSRRIGPREAVNQKSAWDACRIFETKQKPKNHRAEKETASDLAQDGRAQPRTKWTHQEKQGQDALKAIVRPFYDCQMLEVVVVVD